MNGRTEYGVLEGKWMADRFTDGIAPSQWTGSTEILRAYDKYGLPVQYAQCWVLAGVMTTSQCGVRRKIVTTK